MPPFPEALRYLWRIFQRLSSHRNNSGFGVSPILYSEMAEFCRLNRMTLARWEIGCIEELDVVYRIESSRANENRKTISKEKEDEPKRLPAPKPKTLRQRP